MKLIFALSLLASVARAEEGPAFSVLDKDGDKALSSSEFGARRLEWFQRMDADKDGQLSADEFVRGYCGPADKLALPDPKCVSETKARFEEADEDKGGTLSSEEFAASLKRLFSGLDADKNGVIDPAEFTAKPYAAPAKGVLFRFKTGKKGGKQTAPKPEEKKQGDGK